MDTFQGKVAIVSGGASGIGRAAASRLAREGALVAVFDRSEAIGDEAVSYMVDVTDQDSVSRAVAEVVARWGHLDIVVNCAGIGAAGRILENDDAEWMRVFNINVMGAVRVIRAAIPHLIAAQPSSVVNVGSAVALTGFPNRSLYTASKGALVSLTRALAADHLADGVRFNSVNPGTTETPWIQRLLDAADDSSIERSNLEARQPHGRLVTADEVADAIAYLASPRAQSTNGVALSVDAGIEALYVSH
ncbi:SDR family oxidoreductase [Microbacterium sp. 4R-513]|uniref:SDR family NAD(P)-dependent oxidoreductase n=1 Tax=Microbacterium sp. 4R-513 TaxID=2567934 RepID=UPI0013E18BDD|nr:SDR family oxidoreductase [Microbacterium sp. 4R-513]QIG39425.1 SDR family oxidoreductase [Microbacterium sp. 4R-513]